jgi:3-methyladenine DNA glycosylase AlkD
VPNKSTAAAIHREMKSLGSQSRAEVSQRFFKTGPGEYGEGDRFLGLSVPQVGSLEREHKHLSLAEIQKLLRSPWHEERLLALVVLVRQYERGDDELRDAIYRLYLRNTSRINSWDLVDCSAPHIVGAHIPHGTPATLVKLARSKLVWERRIAILATFHYIRQGEMRPTLRIAEILLGDSHDLIHKAVGWMLREVGKRDQAAEENFLRNHAPTMPRTMLRYAIERFPDKLRRKYMEMERKELRRTG